MQRGSNTYLEDLTFLIRINVAVLDTYNLLVRKLMDKLFGKDLSPSISCTWFVPKPFVCEPGQY
jgi:hypothetical protein